MESDKKSKIDLTDEASKESVSEPVPVSASRQAGPEELFEGPGFAATPAPDDDDSGENRVTTSISED